MLEAVFISDLHLHPLDAAITLRFKQFLHWAKKRTQAIYILGDFFHAWAGDDGLDAWSLNLASELRGLSDGGIKLYFMAGNRDFLLGKGFAKEAKLGLLPDPSLITLGEEKILLSHGDRYCTKDNAHKALRFLTRNALFPRLFLSLPYSLREKLVFKVREKSKSKAFDPVNRGIVVESLIKDLQRHKTTTVIHGHIHQPGLTRHRGVNGSYLQYVLSDWDDKPVILCYHPTKGLFFERNCLDLEELSHE